MSTPGPCPLCGKIGGTRIGSTTAFYAFGVWSAHEKCLEEVHEILRATGENPVKWAEMIKGVSSAKG